MKKYRDRVIPEDSRIGVLGKRELAWFIRWLGGAW